ncbi:MAG: valine--tRNA ligase, partial [Deltaproteobacteria bacterium]|nr:valine--tRNA ligase [Deltaproteobacteria bacterium]
MSEFSKGYDPREIEGRWYERWMAAEAFKADAHSDKPAYTIVIPPPNVTGSLHMGHALTNTIQDVLIRWKRMSGFEALWLPGTDHAGIATQMVVERDLKKRGLDRREMGREAFLEHTWLWKEKYGNRISMQLRRLGSSLDWSRERFTMDEGLSKAVREVFVRLWEEGLIYQDDRLVNWDPAGQTVLSDLEVEQEEEDGFLWHIAYPVAGSDERLVVATTRPETLLGDTAVAVNPADPRYLHLHGKEIALPLTDRRIPIIADGEAASMEFGSGAVKITPAHDFNDFETGRRHNLPRIAVLDLDAKMNGNVPERFRGLDRFEARKRIVEELTELGLLVKAEPHKFMPARSQRTGVIVEPLSVGKQWYVKMQPLAEPAIAAVREGKVTFVPEGWEKTYYHWMENIRDWCISRQLWWGHRIPAWTCGDCGTLSVSREDLHNCPKCGSASLRQDEDVLDTWFSSALWPFSTLGWPDQTDDLEKFYPNSVMVTGYDIIYFWV